METQTKILKNIGVLDLRSAAEETLASIKALRNVGLLITSPETAPLVSRIPESTNIGATMEASARAQIRNGQEILSSTSLREVAEPMDLIINGQMIVGSDVTTEDVEKGLGRLWFNGQILYPEHLAGPIESRVVQSNGQSKCYRDCTKLFTGNLTLDPAALTALPDGSTVVVIGNVKAYDVLPPEEVSRRIKMLEVTGRIVLREENAEALLGRLDQGLSSTGIEKIPAGHAVVEDDVVLDGAKLKSLPHRKVYFRNDVRFESGVQPDQVSASLDAAVIKGTMIAPAQLEEAIASICDLSSLTTIFYDGALWLEQESATIAASRFEYLEGKATLVVHETVTIDPDVDPKVLADRLAKVHNFGTIRCTPEQMGAIQARLGINEGRITSPKQKEESKTQQETPDSRNEIANAGILKL